MAVPSTFVELCEAQQENKISNVIGVVIDALPPTRSSKGDFMLTFTLDDRTLQNGQKCRLFTKTMADLPPVNGPGDVIILKRVRFSYVRGEGLLSSIFAQPASWAIFHSPLPKTVGLFGSLAAHKKSKQMSTVTEQEMEYVMSLSQEQDRSKFTVLTEDVKKKLNSEHRHGPCLIKDLMIDTYTQIIGEVVKVFYNHDRASIYITDYTENNLLYDYGSASNEINQVQWPGPPGKFTLMIECWEPHSDWIRANVSQGDIVKLDNVHIKMNRDEQGRIEGALHTHKKQADRILVSKIAMKDAATVMVRKEQLGWAEGFQAHADEDSDQRGQKRKSDSDQLTKNQKRKLRKKQREQEANEMVDPSPDVNQNAYQSSPQIRMIRAIDSPNENIRCEKGDYKERTLFEIRNATLDKDGRNTTASPTEETTSYATVRVVDFKPTQIEDFSRSYEIPKNEHSQGDKIKTNPSDEHESDDNSDHSDTSLHNKSTQVRRTRWEWKFALLLEEATSKTGPQSKDSDKSQLIAYVTGSDAEYLLGMKALDLRTNPRTLSQVREKLFLLWGDLEELKIREAARKEERALEEIVNKSSSASSSNSSQLPKPSSRPFKCLIEEYGEHVRGRWQRKFKIKGTTIMMQLSSSSSNNTHHSQMLESWDDVDIESPVQDMNMVKPQPPYRAPRA